MGVRGGRRKELGDFCCKLFTGMCMMGTGAVVGTLSRDARVGAVEAAQVTAGRAMVLAAAGDLGTAVKEW